MDLARIYVKGGDGGRGSNAMRREKFVPEGGPFGGDGGKGGDVVLVVDPGLRTLLDFKYQRHYRAERGEHGKGKGMHGRDGEDLVVKVPPGTVVRDAETGEVLFDLVEPGQRAVVARGGRGGRGNMHFATPTHRAPTMYEEGEPGEERWLLLELKVVADVGLVGYPNAGKSTLLAHTTAARPRIADYPFTTLTPNLGVVEVGDGRSFVMADIPGLIEGAHAGVGLGHEFLRHVERTRVLIQVVDGSGIEGRDPLADYETIRKELALYSPVLAERPHVVAFNKMDLAEARAHLPSFEAAMASRGIRVFPISAATGQGVGALLLAVADLLDAVRAEGPAVVPDAGEAAERVFRAADEAAFTIRRRPDAAWVVKGKAIERLAAMTPWNNEEAVRRFLRILRRSGIEAELRARGARDGDTVEIAGVEFELSGGEPEA